MANSAQISNNSSLMSGNIGGLLFRNNFDASCLRTHSDNSSPFHVNGVLRQEEFERFDDVVIRAGRERLNAVADVHARGLTTDLPNPLGYTQYTWTVSNSMEAAVHTMDGRNNDKNDARNLTQNSIPIPITHKDFEIDSRTLHASRNGNQPLDTWQAEDASRGVSEALEDAYLNGIPGLQVNGNTVSGILNQANRIQNVHGSAPALAKGYSATNWSDNVATTGNEIYSDVVAMKADLHANQFYGPKVLYIPTNVESRFDELLNPSNSSNITIRDAVLKLDTIDAIIVVDQLPDSTYTLVSMDSGTVQIIDGMSNNVLQWSSLDSLVFYFKVMAIQPPLIRDRLNKAGTRVSGIVQLTGPIGP